MPYRSFFIGATTPKQNPDYYLNCINELYKTYMLEIAHKSPSYTPLIINTHGWVRGIVFFFFFFLISIFICNYIYILTILIIPNYQFLIIRNWF